MYLHRWGKWNIHFKNACYKNCKEEVILRITIDKKLNFVTYIRKMCKKSVGKLDVLSRISTFLNKDQNNDMIQPQFCYCLSNWMLSSRKFSNLIKKKINKMSLRPAKKVERSSFATSLQNNKHMTVHQKKLHILMTKVYKVVKGEAPAITKILKKLIKNFKIIGNEKKIQ